MLRILCTNQGCHISEPRVNKKNQKDVESPKAISMPEVKAFILSLCKHIILFIQVAIRTFFPLNYLDT